MSDSLFNNIASVPEMPPKQHHFVALTSDQLSNMTIGEAAARENFITRIITFKTTALRDKMRADSLLSAVDSFLVGKRPASAPCVAVAAAATGKQAANDSGIDHPASPTGCVNDENADPGCAAGAPVFTSSSVSTSSSFHQSTTATVCVKSSLRSSSTAQLPRSTPVRRVRWDPAVRQSNNDGGENEEEAPAAAAAAVVITDTMLREHAKKAAASSSINNNPPASSSSSSFSNSDDAFTLNIPSVAPLLLLRRSKAGGDTPVRVARDTDTSIEDKAEDNNNSINTSSSHHSSSSFSMPAPDHAMSRLQSLQFEPEELRRAQRRRKMAASRSRQQRAEAAAAELLEDISGTLDTSWGPDIEEDDDSSQ